MLLHGCCTQSILLVILHSQDSANAPTFQDALPRPAAHVCHPAPLQQRQPQDRLRNARSFLHSYHSRHLQPCTVDHARERHSRPTADCDDLDPLARVFPWLRAYTRLWSTTGRQLPVLLMVRNSAFEVYRTTLPG